jgi:hypothetical protein
MNFSEMTVGQRVWWLLVLPLLAGLGVVQVLDWLPDSWFPWALIAGALAGLVWAERQIRWSRRVQREIERDCRRLEDRFREPTDV